MSLLNKKKNAWITGHSGFLGEQLIKDLNEKFQIFKISRNDILESNKFFKKKIYINEIKRNDLKKFKNNFLFHLATLYNPNPKSIIDVKNIIESNLSFGLRVLNNIGHDYFSKILLTQSSFEFQDIEYAKLYIQTKAMFANELEQIIPKKIIKIYLYDTFGLSDKRNKLVKIWLKKLMLNQPITIFSENTLINLSSGKFVSKILSKINSIKPGSYEIRSDVQMTLIELLNFFKEITNSKSKIIIKNNKPIIIINKYDNLSKIFNINYTISDFKKDIIEILNNKNF